MRDSFVLYTKIREMVVKLTDEQKGILFQAILDFETDNEVSIDDPVIDMAFIPIRQDLEANNEKWENIRNARSEAGKRSGEVRKQKETNQTSVNFVQTKMNKKEQIGTNPTVYVNDNVKDLNLSCAKDSHEADTKTIDERKKYNFEIIYKAYPKKVGKQGALDHYLGWISKKGRCINGKYRRLTNEQIFAAVKKYVKQMQDDGKDLQYYQGFDRFMNKTILDYLEEETNDTS